MPPAMPFWKSKTFWTLVIAFAVNLIAILQPGAISEQVTKYLNELLVVLGIAFRWSATQPLTTSGGTK